MSSDSLRHHRRFCISRTCQLRRDQRTGLKWKRRAGSLFLIPSRLRLASHDTRPSRQPPSPPISSVLISGYRPHRARASGHVGHVIPVTSRRSPAYARISSPQPTRCSLSNVWFARCGGGAAPEPSVGTNATQGRRRATVRRSGEACLAHGSLEHRSGRGDERW